METKQLIEDKHHIQQDLCKTRPPYRQGKKLTAVKVYTISSESQHLFIYGVPKINLRPELKTLCSKYGVVKNLYVVSDRKTEIFTECYHVQFERIQSARIAKRFIDNRSFYGSCLHVCYAPEFESLDESRAKLHQRQIDVYRRLNDDTIVPEFVEKYKEPNRRKKRPAVELSEERLAGLDPDVVWKGIPKDIDPMEPTNSKRACYPQKHYKKKSVVEYGPSALDYVPLDNNDACDNTESILIPSQVMKLQKNFVPLSTCEKKIVFRNRKPILSK